MRPNAPSPAEPPEPWPSPESVSRIIADPILFGSPFLDRPNLRVRVLTSIGELMDHNLLSESEVVSLFEIAFRGDKEVAQLADVLDARSTSNGKAQFLKLLLLSISQSTSGGGFTTPTPSACFFPHATPFVELPSAFLRSASPPLRFPTALRPPSACQKLNCIQEDLVRAQSEDADPKLSPSTNVGSSMEISPQCAPTCKPPAETAACTVCRE